MGIDVPNSAVRTSLERKQLVESILNAPLSEQETDWLEWKSSIDMNSRQLEFYAVKNILGFANREPLQAAARAEGCAYLVFGVEPQSMAGVEVLDSETIESRIGNYLGRSGPRWHCQYVAIADKNALLIVVEPPREGDGVFPLRKPLAYNNKEFEDGAIFVRRQGKTVRANSDEIASLVDRASARGAVASVVVESTGTEVLAWFESAPSDVVADLIARERRRLLRGLSVGKTLNALTANAFQTGFQDLRDETKFRAQVEKYLGELRDWARAALPEWAVDSKAASVKATIENTSTEALEEVHFHLELVEGVSCLRGSCDIDGFRGTSKPEAPIPWGQETRVSRMSTNYVPASPRWMAPAKRFRVAPTPMYSDVNGRDFLYRETIKLIHPGRTTELDAVHLLVENSEHRESVSIPWSLTSRTTSGKINGALEFQLAESPVDLAEVFKG